MRKTVVILAGLALCLASCGGKKEQKDLGTQIEQAEKKLDMRNPSPAQLNHLAGLYTRYADSLPQDKNAPVYLMKASDLYHTQGNYARTCQLYKIIIEKYPDFKDLDMVMYLYASSLDSELDDRAEAKKQYQLYLEKFPKSPYVEDARARLTTIDSLSFKQLQDRISQKAMGATE